MPVTRMRASAGLAIFVTTSRFSLCMNSRWRGSFIRSASGNAIESAKVAPRPTIAALMWRNSEIV